MEMWQFEVGFRWELGTREMDRVIWSGELRHERECTRGQRDSGEHWLQFITTANPVVGGEGDGQGKTKEKQHEYLWVGSHLFGKGPRKSYPVLQEYNRRISYFLWNHIQGSCSQMQLSQKLLGSNFLFFVCWSAECPTCKHVAKMSVCLQSYIISTKVCNILTGEIYMLWS